MSPLMAPNNVVTDSFPRVSGDEPTGAFDKVQLYGFSPRERG